jgi:predicted TIM-barrel fold metal-dependent hydrolase
MKKTEGFGMKPKNQLSRRQTLQNIGGMSTAALLGSMSGIGMTATTGEDKPVRSSTHETILKKVFETPFIDTHEHLLEEKSRLAGAFGFWKKADDWSLLLSHYLDSDLLAADMPQSVSERFFSSMPDPLEKWSLLEPYWPAVKNTGYGQAVRIAMRELYGVSDLSGATVKKIQTEYEKVRRPGFYRKILCELGKIESCQVNCLSQPFGESDMPALLMQDISIVGMFDGPDLSAFGKPAGINARSLEDWHRVIDWWFNKYAKYAVAVKSQNAYSRNIDYEQIPAEKVQGLFKKQLEGEKLGSAERKDLEDHLFWYAVKKATENQLPIKLHTGYYAGQNNMPLGRLLHNAGSATDLCRRAPDSRFVFMHICYPYYEEMIAVAKQYTNAYLDMCWSWIINPVAAKDFLKKYLVTAPANKLLTFGGDYIPVEPVLGHATIARHGIALALTELIQEGWLSTDDAMELVDPIMHANARRIVNLGEKKKIIESVKWNS